MLVGYIYASRAEGEAMLERQRVALNASWVPILRKHEDYTVRRSEARPELEKCLQKLSRGDILVVWQLERLGRTLRHLVMLLDELIKRGVGLRALADQRLDTTGAQGHMVIAVLNAVAACEHEAAAERARASLVSARARGRNGGRRFKMTLEKLRRAQVGMQDGKMTVDALCAELGITRQALYGYVGPDGQLRARGEKLLGHAGTAGPGAEPGPDEGGKPTAD